MRQPYQCYLCGFIIFVIGLIIVIILKKDKLHISQFGLITSVFFYLVIKPILPFSFDFFARILLIVYCGILCRLWYLKAEDTYDEKEESIGYHNVDFNAMLAFIIFISLFEKFL